MTHCHILICIFLAASLGTVEARADDVGETASPLPFNVANVKRGKQYYAVHCVSCHGTDGRGDTEMREFLKTAPSDLTDGQWIHGDTDAAIFDVVKNGRSATDMPAFQDQLNDERVWQVVVYIRYLGGQRP